MYQRWTEHITAWNVLKYPRITAIVIIMTIYIYKRAWVAKEEDVNDAEKCKDFLSFCCRRLSTQCGDVDAAAIIRILKLWSEHMKSTRAHRQSGVKRRRPFSLFFFISCSFSFDGIPAARDSLSLVLVDIRLHTRPFSHRWYGIGSADCGSVCVCGYLLLCNLKPKSAS